jgi:hypothetical protein
MSTITKVLDYEAMGKKKRKPNRLHREDCSHPIFGGENHAVYRDGTPEELATLKQCQQCQWKEHWESITIWPVSQH